MPRQPTPEEIEILADCISVSEAKRRVRAGKETINYWIDSLGHRLKNGTTRGPANRTSLVERDPITEGAMPPSRVWHIPEDAIELDSGIWNVLENLQRELRSLEYEEDEINVTIKDDKPVLVNWLADAHLGHTGTDMAKLRADLEAIRNTEGLYTILGGDLMDNVVTSVANRGMAHEQLTPVRVQKQLIEDAVCYLGKENVLAMIIGNHEAWSMASDDFDPVQYLARKIGCSYLGAFGFINIHLGEQTYRILAGHQFRMRSSFNVTHQAKRMEDFIGDADVVFTGHTHQAGSESTRRRGNYKFYGQAGSYMTAGSRYSKGLGFPRTTPEMPGVILFPDRFKVHGVDDTFDLGPPILESFRSRY